MATALLTASIQPGAITAPVVRSRSRVRVRATKGNCPGPAGSPPTIEGVTSPSSLPSINLARGPSGSMCPTWLTGFRGSALADMIPTERKSNAKDATRRMMVGEGGNVGEAVFVCRMRYGGNKTSEWACFIEVQSVARFQREEKAGQEIQDKASWLRSRP